MLFRSEIVIIDALTHILHLYFSEHRDEAIQRDATFKELFSNPKARIVQDEELLRSMDDSGIEKSVIAGFGWVDPELAKMSNDFNLECAYKHGGRLAAACSVNPMWDGDLAIVEAKRCLDSGAVAIGELHADTQGWAASSYHCLDSLADLAKCRGAPIIVHASEPVGHAYAGKGSMTPDRLIRLAQRFPENRFVFPHLGGGLPFYEQMPEVAKALKNVWYDSAAAPFLYSPRAYTSASIAAGAHKIIFASDYPLLTQRRALNNFDKADLPEDAKQKVLHLNAAKLYPQIVERH